MRSFPALSAIVLLPALACGGSGGDSATPDDTGQDTGAPDTTACVGDTPGAAFQDGGSAGYYQLGQDFTVETTAGSWNFAENWDGCHSYVFEFYYSSSDYSDAIWSSDIGDLVDETTENAHYFFLSYTEDDATRLGEIEAVESDFELSLALLSTEDAAQIRERFHFVTDFGWDADWLSEMYAYHFSIDRFQTIRPIGMLYDYAYGTYPMSYLAYESTYFDFEWDRQQWLESVEWTELDVYTDEDISDSSWSGTKVYSDVDLTGIDLSAYDTLYLDLTMDCYDSDADGNEDCPEWDREVNLYLCDADDPDSCGEEFGRWITAYARPGRWVTDHSALLALLQGRTAARFGFHTIDRYEVSLKLRMANSGAGKGAPASVTEAWGSLSLDENYNDNREDLSFDVPATATKVEFVTILTGHGSATDTKNCAEFCNHEHHFSVNGGTAHTKDHTDAGTWSGCLERVNEGVVPNQWGSWPYGRAGWCPGHDVAPWAIDITDQVTAGASNTLSYTVTVDGSAYVPVYSGSGDYYPTISMSSWVVYWE